ALYHLAPARDRKTSRRYAIASALSQIPAAPPPGSGHRRTELLAFPVGSRKHGADAPWITSLAHMNDVAQDRIGLGHPAAAAEDAVMADADLDVVMLFVRAEARAQFLGGEGLADRADVIALALDRQKKGLADRARIDAAAAPAHRAAWQIVLLED